MPRITVQHRYGTSFDVRVRGYSLISDQPVTLGGEDEGPAPTELVVAGLAACAADAAAQWLAAHELPVDGLAVDADFTWSADGSRVERVEVDVHLPPGLEDRARAGVAEAIHRCPVRHLLMEPVRVEFEIEGEPEAVAARSAGWPFEPPPDVDSA